MIMRTHLHSQGSILNQPGILSLKFIFGNNYIDTGRKKGWVCVNIE